MKEEERKKRNKRRKKVEVGAMEKGSVRIPETTWLFGLLYLESPWRFTCQRQLLTIFCGILPMLKK